LLDRLEDREPEEGKAPPGGDDRGCGWAQGGRRPRRQSLQVAVVTGASSGIGAGLVRALKRRGTLVVGLSRRPSEADEHEECDVADREAVEEVAGRVLARHPSIDLLVCNAGLAARGSYLSAGPERIEQVTRVNYLGAVWTTLAFLPGLGDGSHLVNV